MTQHTQNDPVDDVPFAQRVLLLPHCLRPTEECPGKMTRQGLDCTGCTRVDCAVYQLRETAASAGYEGICVAPGGRLAVRFLVEHQPAGVVAVACDKEIEEGLEAIDQIEWQSCRPLTAVIPLTKDGCVDTEVDIAEAQEIILSHNGCVAIETTKTG